ncbi:hypothetical protein DdX_14342 [Ditylenchus destructor]|uniref:Uncharacterized protein n=1 Tax=Ditylenchus destructor TaxID=166010 RepID=A0AAD4R1T9_9BILA|nr:hypothetical protein DdX_14342 [Ditylenchus destructor]
MSDVDAFQNLLILAVIVAMVVIITLALFNWSAQTSTIVFGLLCCSIHLVSLIFFPRSDQRFYNILGVFCSGFLVVAHFWKLSHLYLPFLLYNVSYGP